MDDRTAPTGEGRATTGGRDVPPRSGGADSRRDDTAARSARRSPSADGSRPVHDRGEPLGDAVVGADGLARCPWGDGDPVMRAYHDEEWGMPVRGEQALYERMMLEAFQSGLSWRTILNKREGFRAAFDGFDPEIVAGYGDAETARLMADAGIVRNRAKIAAAITNAKATVALRGAVDGGLDALIWSFKPEVSPRPVTLADVQGKTPESTRLAKTLKSHGFAFVGPTTAYALMEATGVVDTHLAGCHRRGASGVHAR